MHRKAEALQGLRAGSGSGSGNLVREVDRGLAMLRTLAAASSRPLQRLPAGLTPRALSALASLRTPLSPSTLPPPATSSRWRALSVSAADLMQLPSDVGPFALNNISDNYGARAQAKRVGRGVGNGRGRKCTRGQKGQHQRAGNHGLLTEEGGQAKVTKRFPKRGFRRPNQPEYCYINLDTLQESVRSGRLAVPADRPLNVKDFVEAKLITHRMRHAGLALLGRCRGEPFETPVRIEAQEATHGAIAAVEAAGGSVETVYYSRLTLRALLKPEKFEKRLMPRPALPPPRTMRKYMSEEKRGYLRNLAPGDVVRPQEHPEHVDFSLRRPDERAPGWGHHTKSPRRLKKEALLRGDNEAA